MTCPEVQVVNACPPQVEVTVTQEVIEVASAPCDIVISGAINDNIIDFPASESVNQYTVVAVINGQVEIASADDLSHSSALLGILLDPVNTGNISTGLYHGLITNGLWSFNVSDPIFLGLNGTIVQDISTVPTALFVRSLGYVVQSTQLYLNIEEGLEL